MELDTDDISRTYDKDIHIVTCSNGVFEIDGVTVHTVASWAGTAKELFLFGGNAGGSVKTGSMGYVRIFWCKIYNGATLVRDYVPWERDGVAGLLDRQNNDFYSSATATQLTAGPDVNRETLTVPAGVTTNFVTRTDLGRIEQIEKVVFKDPTATLVYSVSSGNGVPNTIAYEGAGTIRCEVESDAAAFDVATGVAFGSAAFDNFTGRIVIVSSETVGDKLTATFDSLPGDFGAITVTNGATLVFNCSGTPANGGLTFAGTGTPVVDVEAGCDVVISGAAAAPNGFVKTGFGILRLTGDRAEVVASKVTSKRGWLFLGDTLVINDSTYRETLADFGFTPILFGTEHCGSGNCGPENAFDGDSSITADNSKRYLASLNGPHPMIVYGVPGVKFTMTHYRLCQLRCGGYVIDRVPTKWKLEGGDTAAGPWTVIDQRKVTKNFWGGVNDPWRKFDLAEPQTYSFFKITFEESGLDKDNWRVGLMEIEYCGGAKTVPADWTEQKKGATVTIPANTILVVKSADVANVNALAKIVFADKTSILHYRGINNTVAPAVALEGEGTVKLDFATDTTELTFSKVQTAAWKGTWDLVKGKVSIGNAQALYAASLTQLGDVYVCANAILMTKGFTIPISRARIHLCSELSIGSGKGDVIVPFGQILVEKQDASLRVLRYTVLKSVGFDEVKSFIDLQGQTLSVTMGYLSTNGGSYLAFDDGCVKGPGTFKIDKPWFRPMYDGEDRKTDFMFADPTVTVQVKDTDVLSNYIKPPFDAKAIRANHPDCPQLATLVAGNALTLEHRHLEGEPCDCGEKDGFLWAGPIKVGSTLTLSRTLATTGDEDHFLPFTLGDLSVNGSGNKTIKFVPAVFTNAVVRYTGKVASNVYHDGYRWDGRFEIKSGADISGVMKIANAEGSVGVIRQTGGSVRMTNGSTFGVAGTSPAYLLEGGGLTNTQGLVMAGDNVYFRQTGGDFRSAGKMYSSSASGLQANLVFGGTGSAFISGIEFEAPTLLAVGDSASVIADWNNKTDYPRLLALNGGCLAADFAIYSVNDYAFNGGVLASIEGSNNGSYTMFADSTWARVYENGGGLLTRSSRIFEIIELAEPAGNVLKSIALSDELKNKVWQTPPTVVVSDETGTNAAAVVDYDFVSGKVTNITVVCRGENYTAPTANLYYHPGEPLLETDLVCAVGPCVGGDFTFAAEGSYNNRFYATVARAHAYHGDTIIDLDRDGVWKGQEGQSEVQYNGNLQVAAGAKFINTTKIVLKSGSLALGYGNSMNNSFPQVTKLELYDGHLSNCSQTYDSVLIAGDIHLANRVNAYSTTLTIAATGRLVVDASATETPKVTSGGVRFTAGATLTLRNYEGLLADDFEKATLLDLSGTTVTGTPVVEIPDALADLVSVRWNATTQMVTASRRRGVIIVVR